MNFRSRSYRLAGRRILSITIILFDGLTGFTQAPQADRHFRTQGNPRITISNAYSISIVSWAKDEVSIVAEVSGASIQVDEVRITPEKSKLDIACNPSKPDRDIYLTPTNLNYDGRFREIQVQVNKPMSRSALDRATTADERAEQRPWHDALQINAAGDTLKNSPSRFA